MGSLGGCLKRFKIDGAEATYIRNLVKDYRNDGMSGPDANIRAVTDLLTDLNIQKQSILDQIYQQVPGLKPPVEVQETPDAPPDVATIDESKFEPLHIAPVYAPNNAPEAGYTVSQPGKLDKVIRILQDKGIDLKRVVQAIQDAGFTVPDELNPVFREEMYHKRAEQRSTDFKTSELKPFLDLMKKNGMELKEADQYAHARHVLTDNLNARLQDLNPDMAGTPEFEKLAGITDAEARDIIKSMNQKYGEALMTDLMNRVDAMVNKTRDLMVEYGLESQDRIDRWRKQYETYVPLHREGFEEGGSPTGTGFSVRGSTAKDRLGSALKVVDVIANVAQARDQVISRGEKMRPVVALAGLLLKFPNRSFARLDKYAEVEYTDPTTGLTETVPSDVGGYQRPMVRKRVPASMEDYLASKGMIEDDIDAMSPAEKKAFRADYRQWSMEHATVKFFPDPSYKGRDNVVNFRIKGKDYAIIFNEDDPRAIEVAKGLKNIDTPQLNGALKAVAPFTRYLASINTQYNPIFGLVNFVRDVQFAMLSLSSTELAGAQGEVVKNLNQIRKGIWEDARAVRSGGVGQSEMAQLWRRFEQVGGPTGYRDLFFSSTERADELQRLLSPSGWSNIHSTAQFMKALESTSLFKWLSDYNLTAENTIRLAVFKAGIDRGLGDIKAASLAKNVTVNFNKKGQYGAQAGSLYAFFNANVQGTARLIETLADRTPDGGWRLSSTGKRIITGGILLGVLQTVALGLAGLEDDEPPEFVKQRNLVIPVPGTEKGYVQIPLPLGFNLLPTAGRLAAETVNAALGGRPPKAMDKGANLLDAILNTFNPIGGGTVLQTFAPTLADPGVALAENKDWTGKRIYQENISSTDKKPGHLLAKDTATIWASGISKMLNWVTGGDDYTPGKLSYSPDAIDYLIGQVTGGVGREGAKLAQIGRSELTGEEIPTHKVPLLGRFYGQSGGSTGTRDRFYDNVRKVNEAAAGVEGRAKDGKEFAEYLREHPESGLRTTALRFQREIGKLREDKHRIISEGGKKEDIQLREKQINNLMQMFNDQVERIKKSK